MKFSIKIFFSKCDQIRILQNFCENWLSRTILYDIFRDNKLSWMTEILNFYVIIILFEIFLFVFNFEEEGDRL